MHRNVHARFGGEATVHLAGFLWKQKESRALPCKVDGEVVRSWEGHFDGKPAQYFGIRAHYDEDEQQAILQFILKDQIRRHSGLPEAAS